MSLFSNKAGVLAAITEFAEDGYATHNFGKTYFCLDRSFLQEYCGHYLLNGSEYLLCIANRIGEGPVLRKRGRATVIECDIPISEIPNSYLRCLAGQILREIFEKYCDRHYRSVPIDFGLYITSRLRPENIAEFHFPTNIPNPHNRNVRED